MTAHHAVLVVNVTEVEEAPEGAVPPTRADEPAVLRHLREIHDELDARPPIELYHEAQHHLSEGQSLYALGQLDARRSARGSTICSTRSRNAVRARLEPATSAATAQRARRARTSASSTSTSSTSRCSSRCPDVWAIDQVFPIVPIDAPGRGPTRRGVIADLTCDSDGRIDHYVESEGLDRRCRCTRCAQGESYRLGIFLVGAYQETLGDIHNLFGDTDAVERAPRRRRRLRAAAPARGDTTDVMLDYVGYTLDDAARGVSRQGRRGAAAGATKRRSLLAALEAGLTGYTYLSDAPLPLDSDH